MNQLRGEVVVLRPVDPGDAERLREIRLEPAVREWWGALEDEFPLADEPAATRYTVIVGEEIAGMIQFAEEDETDYRHASMDLFVATAHHGRGVGTDAVRTLARHLVEERGHHRLTIDPAVDNVAAVRAYEKAGFRRVGVLRYAERTPRGDWRDTLFMEQVFPSVLATASDERTP